MSLQDIVKTIPDWDAMRQTWIEICRLTDGPGSHPVAPLAPAFKAIRNRLYGMPPGVAVMALVSLPRLSRVPEIRKWLTEP
jgi:hypothetical protein